MTTEKQLQQDLQKSKVLINWFSAGALVILVATAAWLIVSLTKIF